MWPFLVADVPEQFIWEMLFAVQDANCCMSLTMSKAIGQKFPHSSTVNNRTKFITIQSKLLNLPLIYFHFKYHFMWWKINVQLNCRVHAVIVASPTFTHEDIVINSLNAKKAVFCEKPVEETRKDTEHCFEVAKKVGKPLFTAFNRRFDPSYNAVRA